MIKDHVLLPRAGALREVDAHMSGQVTPDIIAAIVQLIPDTWLPEDAAVGGSNQQRAAYREYLLSRLQPPHGFLEEAIRARSVYV